MPTALHRTASGYTSLLQLAPSFLGTPAVAIILRISQVCVDDSPGTLALRSCPLTSFAPTPVTWPSRLQSQAQAPHSPITRLLPTACLTVPTDTALPRDGELLSNTGHEVSFSFLSSLPCYTGYDAMVPRQCRSLPLPVPSHPQGRRKISAHRSPYLGGIKMECVLAPLILTAEADKEL